MRPVYLGLGVAIILIIVAFLSMRLYEQRQFAVAYATPTPGPNATSKPIQLVDLEKLGKPAFPLQEGGQTADTPGGGHGSPVDGITCESMEFARWHVHSHVALFVRGVQMQIPALVGIVPSGTGGCLYWLHTHGPDGIIHVESPQLHSPAGGPFTLGMFFDIWGEPLTRSQVGPFKGPVTAFVNGAPYEGNLRDVALLAHQQITLEVGKPIVPPPNYAFPADD